MLKAKAVGSPVTPIFAHAMVHSVMMYVVMLAMIGNTQSVLYAFYLQLFSHTIIDVCKGKLNVFPAIKNPASQWHWITFGGDQLLHQLVILWMVYMVTV